MKRAKAAGVSASAAGASGAKKARIAKADDPDAVAVLDSIAACDEPALVGAIAGDLDKLTAMRTKLKSLTKALDTAIAAVAVAKPADMVRLSGRPMLKEDQDHRSNSCERAGATDFKVGPNKALLQASFHVEDMEGDRTAEVDCEIFSLENGEYSFDLAAARRLLDASGIRAFALDGRTHRWPAASGKERKRVLKAFIAAVAEVIAAVDYGSDSWDLGEGWDPELLVEALDASEEDGEEGGGAGSAGAGRRRR